MTTLSHSRRVLFCFLATLLCCAVSPSGAVAFAADKESATESKAKPTVAFRHRVSHLNRDAEHQSDTDKSIETGLVFLMKHQTASGNWQLRELEALAEDERNVVESTTAATGLSLMAFQGMGYHHLDGKYHKTIAAGLKFLVDIQKKHDNLYVASDERRAYSAHKSYAQAIATIALCEAYGMTQDMSLKATAQKEIDFIVAAQDERRGGWRYHPGRGSDTSMTGWAVLALHTGRAAGLDVPAKTFEKVNQWLDVAQRSPDDQHLYRYNPYAPDNKYQRHHRQPSPTMTSVGLLLRLYSGWRPDNKHLIKGADYLLQNLPAHGSDRKPKRDTYYWYYATQVMNHMGGDYWKKWESALHLRLLLTQIRKGAMVGSWEPLKPVPDKWGPLAGRLYVTTMNLLSLEAQYRKLPLQAKAAK